MSVLTLKNVTYKYDGTDKDVLQRVSAEFNSGEVHAIVGQSGSGKSTLLSLIAGLDLPTDGQIVYEGRNLSALDRDNYRSKDIGVIFQGFNLLTNATALENIVLSMDISGSDINDKEAAAINLLKQMDINEDIARRKILKLSGGQQQRVAIARALAHNPKIILADEPTGNLDSETEDDVMEILVNLAKEQKKCVIIITHSQKVADQADVIYKMQSGKLQ